MMFFLVWDFPMKSILEQHHDTNFLVKLHYLIFVFIETRGCKGKLVI